MPRMPIPAGSSRCFLQRSLTPGRQTIFNNAVNTTNEQLFIRANSQINDALCAMPSFAAPKESRLHLKTQERPFWRVKDGKSSAPE